MILTEGKYSIYNLCRRGGLIQTGSIVFDSPIQRESEQWDKEAKSLLIKTVLQNYYIPPVFVSEESREGRKRKIYNVIDGKQRLTILYSFYKNDFPLAKDVVSDLEINGEIYDLTGLKYESLPDELRHAIDSFNVTFYIAQEASDEEIEEMFYRLNNGKVLSNVQRAKAEMGISLSEWIYDISNHEFLIEHAGLTLSQKRNEDNLKVVIQTLMLMDTEGEIKSMAPKTVANYMRNMRVRLNDPAEKERFTTYRDRIYEALTYLTNTLVGLRVRPLTKIINLPMLILTGIKANEAGVQNQVFAEWAQQFSDKIKLSRVDDENSEAYSYLRFAGQGSTQAQKVLGRVSEMQKNLDEYLEEA